jgi:chromosome segregation ATPase
VLQSDQLRVRIDALQSRNASLATQLEKSHSQVDELSLQLMDTKRELQKTQTCLLNAETHAQIMVKLKDDLEQNNTELQSKLQQMREDHHFRSDVERGMKELSKRMEDISQERQSLEDSNPICDTCATSIGLSWKRKSDALII